MLQVRRLSERDLLALEPIEASCFSSPWNRSQLTHQLVHKNRISLGVFHGTELIGFAFFSFILDEAELLQVATDPSQRGLGAAKKLLSEGMEVLNERSIGRLLLEVRASNEAAIMLYKRLGFLDDGCRKGYYPAQVEGGDREDARLMSIGIANE